jgi:hypothetical protein
MSNNRQRTLESMPPQIPPLHCREAAFNTFARRRCYDDTTPMHPGAAAAAGGDASLSSDMPLMA